MKKWFEPTRLVKWAFFQYRIVRFGAHQRNPMLVGLGATKLFLAFVALLAVLPQHSEKGWSWRIWEFLTAPPNEIGDTLAGIAGTLAFLWIIVTVMMQSKELAAQREELRLTREEFARTADAQSALVKLAVLQTDLMKIGTNGVTADRNSEVFEQKFKELKDAVITQFSKGLMITKLDGSMQAFPLVNHLNGFQGGGRDGLERFEIGELMKALERGVRGIEDFRNANPSSLFPSELMPLAAMAESCANLLANTNQVTQSKYEKIDFLGFAQQISIWKTSQ
jgi:hypothetical protein